MDLQTHTVAGAMTEVRSISLIFYNITGGSVNANSAEVNPAPSNGVKIVSRVEVSGFTPGAAVAFDGLPDYYGTDDIYADAGGKAYLWLPEDWTTPVTPKSRALGNRTSTPSRQTSATHTFFANGYSYTVEIPADGGEAIAEQGSPLELSSLRIRSFAVDDGWLVIGVTASPATWLHGFADTLTIYASSSLPISETEKTMLDISGAELFLEDGENATFAVPLGELPGSIFFKVKSK